MEMRALGKSGVKVSKFCLGTMMLGPMGNSDHDDCIRIVHRAMDAGINFIDTADVYSLGESEEILSRALKGRRDDVVLASKFFQPMSKTDPNHRGMSRRWIIKACEDSLRRLGTDYLDLYQVHRYDESTDLDELLGALSDLVHQGKVRMIGSSTFPAETIVEAQWTSERRGHMKLRTEQPPYSIFVRGIERDVLPTCERYGMGVLVWSPLNSGWLTGKYRSGEAPEKGSRLERRRRSLDGDGVAGKTEAVDRLTNIAADAGMDLLTMALGFTLSHPVVTSAIIGPRTMEQLESQLPAAEVVLSPETLDRIDEVVQPGMTLNRADVVYEPLAIRNAAARRR